MSDYKERSDTVIPIEAGIAKGRIPLAYYYQAALGTLPANSPNKE